MSDAITYTLNRATSTHLEAHLRLCDAHFIPPLSGRVRIDEYAAKVAAHAMRLEAWHREQLVGLVAMYCNDLQGRAAFITSVSVVQEWARHGIAQELLGQCAGRAHCAGMERIVLEVATTNLAAVSLYRKIGYVTRVAEGDSIKMELKLNVRTSNVAAT